MKSSKFLPALRQMKPRKASLGERTFSSLVPNRAYGWGTGWDGVNKVEQVQHFRAWTYVFIDLICSKLASITPNIAYVTDQPVPGKTVKAGQRGLRGVMGRGLGAGIYTGGSYSPNNKGIVTGTYMGTDGWDKREPIEGYSFGDGGHSFLTIGEYRSKALSVVQPHEELEPLENDHPLRRLINNPNPYDTCYDYTYEKWMYLMLTGVGYEWLVPNEYRTMPGERWILPSHWMWPRTGGRRPREVEMMGEGFNGRRDEGASYVNPYNLPDVQTGQASQHLVDYYECRPWGGMGSAGILKFPPEEIIMTRFKSPLDKIAGWSPLAAMAQWIDNEESITKCQWGQFANQARPELWIEMGPGYEDPNDDTIARYEAKMMSKFQGEFNQGKPIFTPPGSKVSVLSFNPAEMAYTASGDQVRDMLGSGFRVPKSCVGISQDMTYGSLLATLGVLCAYSLNPKLAMSGQNDTKHLASRWDETTPAYSTLTGKGYGSRETGRKVKLWYDDCLDQETEALTAEGWKRQEELTEDTRIACYDAKTNTLIYRKPKRIVRRQHDGVLHLWEGGRVSAAMTPRHRIYVQPRPKSNRPIRPWEFRLASELAASQDYKVKRAAPAACDDPTAVTLDRWVGGHQQCPGKAETIDPHIWLEFIGYYISEGNLYRNKKGGTSGAWLVTISQADDNSDFEKMSRCVDALDIGVWKRHRSFDPRHNSDRYIRFVRTDRGLYIHLEKHCGKGSLNKKVPDYVKAWPAADLRILLDALIAGDGRKPKVNANTGVWNSQYSTVSKQLADDVQEIAVKCGLSASIIQSKQHNPKHSISYVVNLSSRVEVLVLPTHRSEIPYSGPVWCVEVETGAFVVRRKRMAHITGNCVPADPDQVNKDISQDVAVFAITPNEVRALRGRKPYELGGDNPMGQGAGGPTPLAINVEEDVGEMAKIMAQMTEAQGKSPGETSEGAPEPGKEGEDGQPVKPEGGADAPANKLPDPTDMAEDAAGIESANNPPQKYLREMARKFLSSRNRKGDYATRK